MTIEYILSGENEWLPSEEVELMHDQGHLGIAVSLFGAMQDIRNRYLSVPITHDLALKEARLLNGLTLGEKIVDGHDLIKVEDGIVGFDLENWKEKTGIVIKAILRLAEKIMDGLRGFWREKISLAARLERRGRDKVSQYITDVRLKEDVRPEIQVTRSMRYAFNLDKEAFMSPTDLAVHAMALEDILNPKPFVAAVEYAIRSIESNIVKGDTGRDAMRAIQDDFWKRLVAEGKLPTALRGSQEYASITVSGSPNILSLVRDIDGYQPPKITLLRSRFKLPTKAEGYSPTEASAVVAQLVNLAYVSKEESNVLGLTKELKKLKARIKEQSVDKAVAEELKAIPSWINTAVTFVRKTTDYRLQFCEGMFEYIEASESAWVDK